MDPLPYGKSEEAEAEDDVDPEFDRYGPERLCSIVGPDKECLADQAPNGFEDGIVLQQQQIAEECDGSGRHPVLPPLAEIGP